MTAAGFALATSADIRIGREAAAALVGDAITPVATMSRVQMHSGCAIFVMRDRFMVSDHDYVEMAVEAQPPPNAITLETDPMVILRPEGAWDEPGLPDRSAACAATNPGAPSH